MKLYKRVNRLRVLKTLPKWRQERIRWGLSLKPGDYINDCSMFNCKIIELHGDVHYTKRGGWFIYDVSFTVGPFGGSCSLIHCGVDKALSPEELEKRFREFYGSYETDPEYAAKLGLMTSEDKIWQRLKSGEPICDDLGRCLPEIYDARFEAQARDFYEES